MGYVLMDHLVSGYVEVGWRVMSIQAEEGIKCD